MAKKYTFGLNNASEPQGAGEKSPSPASVSTGKKYTFGLNDYKPNTKGISFEENAQAREEFERSLNPAQPLNIANRHLFEEGELTPALPSPTVLTGQSQSPEISSPRIPQLIPAHEQFQPQERSFLQNLIEGAQAGYYKSAPVKGNNEIDQTMANLMPQSKMLREKAERGKQNIELAKDYESQGVGGWLGGMAADLPYWITGEGLVNAGLKTAAPKLAPIAEKVSGAGWSALQKLAQSNPKAALNIAYSIEKASPYVARAMKDALIGAVVGPIEAIGTGEPEKALQMSKEYAEFGALLGPVFHGVGQVFKGVKNGIKPELPTPEQKLADFQLPRAAQIETPPEPKTFGQRWLDMQKAAENPVKPEINPVESIAEPPRVNIPEEQINPAEGPIKPNAEYYTNGFNQLKETFKNQIDQGEIEPQAAKEILDSIVGEMKTEAKTNGVELPNLDYSDIMPKPKIPETYEEASQRAHDLVAEHIKWLDDTHGQGVEPGGMSFDENGNVSQRWGRESKNELWYGDFYKEHGRKPNEKEKLQIAIDHLRNGTDSTLGKIPANEEFLALEKRLEELKPKEAPKPEPVAEVKPEPKPQEPQPKAEQPTAKEIVAEKAEQPKTFDETLKEFSQKEKAGTVTADEVRAHFQYLQDNKDELIKFFRQKLDNSPKFKNKRKATKDDLAQQIYDNTINNLAYLDGDSVSYVLGEEGAHFKAIKKKIEGMTDEGIQAKFTRERESKAAHDKALENPETISEFERKKAYKGLTPEEQAKYEDLKAQDQKVKDNTKVVSKISEGVEFHEPIKDKHTKTDADLWVVKMKNRVDKDTFAETRAKMKAIGGTWSNFKHGFIFDENPAEQLASLKKGSMKIEQVTPEAKRKAQADKLRGVADNMQETIDQYRGPKLTNTARRARMAASAEDSADGLERTQKIMRNIADAIESGEAVHLDGISARTHIETLNNLISRLRKYKGVGRNGETLWEPVTQEVIAKAEYPKTQVNRTALQDLLKETEGLKGIGRARINLNRIASREVKGENWGVDLTGYEEDLQKLLSLAKKSGKDNWAITRIEDQFMTIKRLQAMGINTVEQYRSAIREFMQYRDGVKLSPEQLKERELKAAERELIGKKFDGYFPTPKKIVDRLLEEADIQPGEKVLEPSAGKGSIADELKAKGAEVNTIEIQPALREVLEKKGHNLVGRDFLEHTGEYDKIVMNPPFEKGQDITHVQRAYDQLKPGGKVVAIMSEGPFFRSDKQATAFREWLEEVNGWSEKLPEGAFKESDRSTGVNTRMVVIEKPVGAKAGVKTLTEKLDAVETAAKDRIKSRQGRVMSGIPADQIADYAVVGATKLAKGIIKYSEWSAEMIKEFGEAIKPQLKEIYNKAVAIRTHQETPQQKLDPNLKLIFGSKSAENAPIERRSFPDTVANGEITDPELKAKLGETVFNYEVKPNQVTLDNAKDFIAQDKEAAKRLVLDEEAPATAETNAMAQLLIKEANDSGNWEDAIKLIEVTAKKATEQGQAIQALSMWGRLTPEGALRHAKNLYEKAKTPEQARGLKEVNDKLGEEIGDINKKAADQIGDELQNDLEGIVKRIKRTTSTGNQLELFPEVKPGKYEGKPGRFERNPEAEQKPKIQQKKEETPAEQLAKRVKNAVKEDSENQVERDAVKTMVNTLFRVAKEALPEKDLRRTKPLDFVVEAIKDRANYRKVWVEARKIVREKFADDPEKLEILEDYFAKGINRTFDQKRLNSAVDEGLKELGIKVSNIVKEHYSLNTKARNDLIQKLVTEAGLSGEEAQILAKHIYNRMKDLTKANKERALRNIFGVRAAMTKRSLSDRIIELSNLGAFQNENYRGLVAQKFNLPELDEATYKSIYKQAQRIQTLEDGRAKDVAIAKMLDTIASKIPPTMLDKLGTIQTIAQLLNPKTLGRNIIGNAGFLGLDNFTQAMAVPMDKAFSKLTGKREIAMPNFSRQKQGFKEGWKLGLEDALLGIDTSGLQSQYQLRKNLTFRAEQAGWDNKILGPLEKALSVGLRATDRAFYNATFFDTLHGLMSVKGVTEPTEEMIKTAQYEGLRRTFQDESVLANLFVGLKDVLNLNTQKLITKRGGKRLGFGAGDFLIKYPKTPANLLQRGIEYSPLGFGRVLWEAGRPLTGIGKQFNQREFSLAFTRALTGSGALVGTGFMLGKLGIVTGKPPGDYDTAQLKRDTGFGEYRINLSALKRYTHDGGLVDFLKLGMKQQAAKTTEQKAEVEKLKRELVKKYEPQPGDVTMSYDWFQPNAINMAIGADIAETKGASDLLGMFVNALSTGINAYAEQPVIKGFSTLFGQKDKTEGFKKVLAGVPASFAPTLFNQVGQLLSNQKRITTSDEYLQGMGNQFKKKIPGLNQTLPKDYTQLGEEAKTYQEGSFLTDNNPINVFLNPAFVNIYNPSKEAKLALDIYYSTGETAQMPKRLENNFTVDKEKFTMTSEELSEMKKFVGQKVKEGYSNIDLDEEDMGSTVKKMTDVLEKSWFEGKKMILDKRNVKYSTKGKSTTIKLDKN